MNSGNLKSEAEGDTQTLCYGNDNPLNYVRSDLKDRVKNEVVRRRFGIKEKMRDRVDRKVL